MLSALEGLTKPSSVMVNPMTGIKEEGDKVSEGGREVCEEGGGKR